MRTHWLCWSALLAASGALAQEPPAPAPPALSKAPRLTRFVEAKPPAALETRGSAEVVLEIDVDETGKVQSVFVTQPAGDGFDEAALEAARQFVFEPGEFEGKPVPVRITYRYRFVSQPPPPPPTPAVVTAPFSGVVLRKGDRTPLEAVDVVLDHGEPATRTDAQGKFELPAVPVGTHEVHFRGAPITPSDATVVVNEGKRLEGTYYLAPREPYTSTVRAEKAVQETVEQTLQGDEIRHIPGTQGDTLKAVQNLPGVARSSFGLGALVVWGSAPQDTRTYVDGIYIPTLYHFGGLRSTFNSEMVESLSFSPGGYGAEYGRGLGGVIEIDSRKPRTDAWHGFAQVDLFDGSFMLSGPINKDLSLSIAGRRSWIDLFLPLFTTSDFQFSPKYYDYQGNLHWRASPRDDVDLLLFGSDDKLHLDVKRPDPTESPVADSHSFYHRGLVRWQHRFQGGATLESSVSAGYDVPFQIVFTEGNTSRVFDQQTFSYGLRTVARVPLAEWLRLDAGVDFEGNRWPVKLTFGPQGPPREGDPGGFQAGGAGLTSDDFLLFTNDVAPFVSAKMSFFDRRLTITPQFRLDVFSNTAYGTTTTFVRPEPRLTARYQLTPWLAPKLAIGLYDQAPQPLDFSRVFGNPDLKPEHGVHYVGGFDLDPRPGLHVAVEGFYKNLSDLVVRREGLSGPALVNDGVGRVYGGEFLVRQELAKGFFGWISYTLSRSERRDHPDGAWRPFQFDQTHILTLIASYTLPGGYQLGARFRYVTGNPMTPVIGAYYDSSINRYTPLFGGVYTSRLGSFNQLDIRLDKTWTYDRWKLSFYLDLQNAYNRQNPEGTSYNFNFTQSAPQSGLPLLPVFGIRGEW